MWTVFIWFFFFLFAINGFLVYIESAMPTFALVSPITNTTLVLPAQPDAIGSLATLNNTNPSNATGAGNISIWDAANYAWNQTIFVVNLLTGGFIWEALAVFGIPTLVFNMIQGMIAVFGILTLLHFWRGIL